MRELVELYVLRYGVEELLTCIGEGLSKAIGTYEVKHNELFKLQLNRIACSILTLRNQERKFENERSR